MTILYFLGQALLQSIGGGCVSYRQATLCFKNENLIYNAPNAGQTGIGQWCNDQGVIAFRHPQDLEKILQVLQ